MAHRAHLFSLKLGHGLRTALSTEPYTKTHLLSDALAGITVGVIAIPLAMALAVATAATVTRPVRTWPVAIPMPVTRSNCWKSKISWAVVRE